MKGARPGQDNFAHSGRVEWMLGHIPPAARVAEVGCGTGWGVTLPLSLAGRNVVGLDLDEASIAYGRGVFRREGVDEARLMAEDLSGVPGELDLCIASELLEHLADPELEQMLMTVRAKLRPGGVVLVTVPNGYGWYELEAMLWRRTGLGRLIRKSGLGFVIRRLRRPFVDGATWSDVPNTLSGCPHVQRFTLRTLVQKLGAAGFETIDARGSVMFCGPFSELIFAGARSAQRLNERLAVRFPRISSGFYVAARKPAITR